MINIGLDGLAEETGSDMAAGHPNSLRDNHV
jgi:hypothetical protein